MYVYGGRGGSGRVFPNRTAVGWSLRAEFPVVECTVTTVTTSAAVSRRPVLVVQTIAVPVAAVMVVMMMMVVLMMVTAAMRPLEVVRGQRGTARRGGQLPALESRRPVARGLAVVHGCVATSAAAARASAAIGGEVPSAHPHAPREEQLEEQPLELLAEYHVDDEVNGRVDRHQQVADLDQLVDGDAIERFHHVRYERPHVAQQEHDHHAQQHGGQPDLLLLQPRQPLPLSVGPPHLQHKRRGQHRRRLIR